MKHLSDSGVNGDMLFTFKHKDSNCTIDIEAKDFETAKSKLQFKTRLFPGVRFEDWAFVQLPVCQSMQKVLMGIPRNKPLITVPRHIFKDA
jgi:hypothetical protein